MARTKQGKKPQKKQMRGREEAIAATIRGLRRD